MKSHSHTFWQDGQLRTIVVEYELENDVYKTSFSGELLRDTTLNWKQLAAALHGMAQS